VALETYLTEEWNLCGEEHQIRERVGLNLCESVNGDIKNGGATAFIP
jgi:hypothetical protein